MYIVIYTVDLCRFYFDKKNSTKYPRPLSISNINVNKWIAIKQFINMSFSFYSDLQWFFLNTSLNQRAIGIVIFLTRTTRLNIYVIFLWFRRKVHQLFSLPLYFDFNVKFEIRIEKKSFDIFFYLAIEKKSWSIRATRWHILYFRLGGVIVLVDYNFFSWFLLFMFPFRHISDWKKVVSKYYMSIV